MGRNALRLIFKLGLLVVGMLVLAGLLLAAVAGALLALLRFVFTGRKPVAFTAFTQFRKASQQFRQGGQPGFGGYTPRGAAPADVVDVQAHEVGQPPHSAPTVSLIPGPKA
jgi:hypothetical protein